MATVRPIIAETAFFNICIAYDGQYYAVTVDAKDPNLEEHNMCRRFDDLISAHKVFSDTLAELLRLEQEAFENEPDLEHVIDNIEADHAGLLNMHRSLDPELTRLVREQQARL